MENTNFDWLYYLGTSLLPRVPYILICLAGIAFALIRWKRHPKISIYAILALTCLILWNIVSILFNVLMFQNLQTNTAGEWQSFSSFINILGFFVNATSLILLLMAIFSKRGNPAED